MPTDEEILQGARDQITQLQLDLASVKTEAAMQSYRADTANLEIQRLKAELYDMKAGIRLVQDSCLTGQSASEVILRRALPILREFANRNPVYRHNGSRRDPCGVHALLADWPAEGEAA